MTVEIPVWFLIAIIVVLVLRDLGLRKENKITIQIQQESHQDQIERYKYVEGHNARLQDNVDFLQAQVENRPYISDDDSSGSGFDKPVLH